MKVYIDFKCPFTNRFHAFLNLVREDKTVEIEWSSFSLDELNRSTEQPIWEQEALIKNPSVLTLAGLEEIKQRDAERVEDYVSDAFLIWHSKESSPELDAAQQLLDKYSITVEGKHFKAVQASHEQAAAIKTVGSPSLLIKDGALPLFIKLDHVPEDVVASWQMISAMAKDDAVLELKQPS